MNDYCLNQSQGLNARLHTSTYNKTLQTTITSQHPPPPTPLPFHLPLDVFLINQKKHET